MLIVTKIIYLSIQISACISELLLIVFIFLMDLCLVHDSSVPFSHAYLVHQMFDYFCEFSLPSLFSNIVQ